MTLLPKINNLLDIPFRDEVVSQGENDHPGRIFYLHFFQYPGAITFNRPLAQVKESAYFLCSMLTAYEPDDLFFPFGKKRFLVFFMEVEFTFDDQGGELGCRVLAVKDIAYVDSQNGFKDLLFIRIF